MPVIDQNVNCLACLPAFTVPQFDVYKVCWCPVSRGLELLGTCSSGPSQMSAWSLLFLWIEVEVWNICNVGVRTLAVGVPYLFIIEESHWPQEKVHRCLCVHMCVGGLGGHTRVLMSMFVSGRGIHGEVGRIQKCSLPCDPPLVFSNSLSLLEKSNF